jgi:hypothetical protein
VLVNEFGSFGHVPVPLVGDGLLVGVGVGPEFVAFALQGFVSHVPDSAANNEYGDNGEGGVPDHSLPLLLGKGAFAGSLFLVWNIICHY